MRNMLVFGILSAFVLTCAPVQSGIPPCGIIENLKSNDSAKVSSTCRSLGFSRGPLGLTRVRALFPHCKKNVRAPALIAVSWEGPTDGHLVLLGPDGDIWGNEKLGYLKSLSLEPLVNPENDNVVTDCITGTGTGTRLDEFHIFSVTDDTIQLIWTGVSYEKSFPLIVAPEDNYEIHGSLVFRDLNNDQIKEIIHTTRRSDYSVDMSTGELTLKEESVTHHVYELIGRKYQRAVHLEPSQYK